MAYKTSNTQGNILLFPFGKMEQSHTTVLSEKSIKNLAVTIGNTLHIPLYATTLGAWFGQAATNHINLDVIVLWLKNEEITKHYFDTTISFDEICEKFHRHLIEAELNLEISI